MTGSCILHTGKKRIAEILSGTGHKLNGMYVEYTNSDSIPEFVPDPSRTLSYYDNLADSSTSGFVRIVSGVLPVIDEENSIVFSGLVTGKTKNFGAPITPGVTRFYSSALVSVDDIDNRHKDVPVLIAPVLGVDRNPCPIKVNGSTYIMIRIKLALGGK